MVIRIFSDKIFSKAKLILFCSELIFICKAISLQHQAHVHVKYLFMRYAIFTYKMHLSSHYHVCQYMLLATGGKKQVTWSSSNHMQVLQYGQVAEPEVSGDPTSPLYSQALAHNELIMHPPERTLPFQPS